MSHAYAEKKREHLRLAMLRLLAEMPDYTLNASLLQEGADAVGVPASRTEVEAEIAWLGEAALVTIRRYGETNLIIPTLTDRGLEVAKGRATVPGVKRPSPGERG